MTATRKQCESHGRAVLIHQHITNAVFMNYVHRGRIGDGFHRAWETRPHPGFRRFLKDSKNVIIRVKASNLTWEESPTKLNFDENLSIEFERSRVERSSWDRGIDVVCSSNRVAVIR